MPVPLLRFGQYLLIAAMFSALGGHWLVLQTVAWGGMIVEYSRESGLTVAVGKTFDGQHPCAMCKTIEKTRRTEKKHEALVVAKKLDVFHQTTPRLVFPVSDFWQQDLVNHVPLHRSQAPSVPPPRNA